MLHKLDVITNRLDHYNERIHNIENNINIIPKPYAPTPWETAMKKFLSHGNLDKVDSTLVYGITSQTVKETYKQINLTINNKDYENYLDIHDNMILESTIQNLIDENNLLKQEISQIRQSLIKMAPELRDGPDEYFHQSQDTNADSNLALSQ